MLIEKGNVRYYPVKLPNDPLGVIAWHPYFIGTYEISDMCNV